jgi:hypothetical protein
MLLSRAELRPADVADGPIGASYFPEKKSIRDARLASFRGLPVVRVISASTSRRVAGDFVQAGPTSFRIDETWSSKLIPVAIPETKLAITSFVPLMLMVDFDESVGREALSELAAESELVAVKDSRRLDRSALTTA